MEKGKGDRLNYRVRHGLPAARLRRKTGLSPFFIVLLGAALCSTAGCGAAVCKDAWFGPGRAQHFMASFAIGAGTSTIAGHTGASPAASTALGLGAVAVAGIAKESVDLQVTKTCWSWKDLAWELFGGAVGTAVGTAASH